MNDLISVIVPVYNVEKYLEKCLTSIIEQTYSNIEIIIINDGATDESGKICADYEKKDGRISVINKTNEGLSAARNDGLGLAKGKYICFVDSDDYLDVDAIADWHEMIRKENADIAIGAWKRFKETEHIEREQQKIEQHVIKGKDAVVLNLKDEIYSYAWGKLYKKELFDNIRFPVGRTYEDAAVLYRVLDRSRRVVITNKISYYYLNRDTSIMHTIGSKGLVDQFVSFYEQWIFAKDRCIEMEPFMAQRVTYCAIGALNQIVKGYKIDTVEYQKINKVLKQNNTRLKQLGGFSKSKKMQIHFACMCPRLYLIILKIASTLVKK